MIKSCYIKRKLGKNDYKVLYFGSSGTQCVVGFVISEGFYDAIKEVERFGKQLIDFTIILADATIHGFASQIGDSMITT